MKDDSGFAAPGGSTVVSVDLRVIGYFMKGFWNPLLPFTDSGCGSDVKRAKFLGNHGLTFYCILITV